MGFVLLVRPDSFRGIREWRNLVDTQSGTPQRMNHTSKEGKRRTKERLKTNLCVRDVFVTRLPVRTNFLLIHFPHQTELLVCCSNLAPARVGLQGGWTWQAANSLIIQIQNGSKQ